MADATQVVVEIVHGQRGDRIGLFSPWFPGVAEMCKSVPGASWNSKKKYWTYPLSMQTCRALRRVFTDMLVIGDELRDWAAQAKAREEGLRELGRLYDTELKVVPERMPKMAEAMARRTYQRVAARFIAEARSVLIADEPAMGKSMECLAGIIEAGQWDGQHLITAPKSALDTTWAEEIKKWTDARAFWMPDGKTRRFKTLHDFVAYEDGPKFLIINPEMLQVKLARWCHQCQRWEPGKDDVWEDRHYLEDHALHIRIQKCDWPDLFEIVWNSIIVDESHKYLLGIKGSGPFKKTQTGEGYTSLQTAEDAVRIAATGSPIKGKAKNFWPTFHWLRPNEYPAFWPWAQEFLEVSDNGFGLTVGDVNPLREEYLYKTLDSIMLRRTRRECQPDLPEKDYQDHWVHMSAKQEKQYDDMLTLGESIVGGKSIQAIGVLAEFTRLKQFSFGEWTIGAKDKIKPKSSPKLDWLVGQLEKRGVTGDPKTEFRLEGGYKYVVASQFTEVVDFIVGELKERGIDCLTITGAVTGKRRSEVQRLFQSEEGPRVLVINVAAGGVAITLDRYCDEMFILDETWVRDDMIQVEGRIDNRNVEERMATRSYHYVRTRGTVEQAIAESGLSQDEIQSKLLDTRRGVEFARRLLKGTKAQ